VLNDGTSVKTPGDWAKRREEIKTYWHGLMGAWPPIIAKPKVEYLDKQEIDGIPVSRIRIETAPGRHVDDAFLLKPAKGSGPFPAVVVVYYEANTAIGRGKEPLRDYAIQLAKRGFVTLSLGGDPNTYYPDKERCRIQPLSFHAYEAANCHSFLAGLPDVDKNRIGVVGHSYGGKWAMFAACLHEPFACGAWSDPGIVFDEKRPSVNYWEPWYLGFDPALKEQRKRGVPNDANPRTGPYRKLMAEGRDLTDLHALMAPRPFFVSGGSEDPPKRWESLNHSVAVNRLLGAENRVGMTNRPDHSPNAKDNEVLYRFFEFALGKVN
jgi:pimeloyl-ACP methyl ester carboxylesterase